MSSAAEKANLARIRDNQRRSRARRKEYLQELEARLHQCELQGIEASAEIQQAARHVADENRKLRILLSRHGISEGSIEAFLQNSNSDPLMNGDPGGFGAQGQGPAAVVLDQLLSTKRLVSADTGTPDVRRGGTVGSRDSSVASMGLNTAQTPRWATPQQAPFLTPSSSGSRASQPQSQRNSTTLIGSQPRQVSGASVYDFSAFQGGPFTSHQHQQHHYPQQHHQLPNQSQNQKLAKSHTTPIHPHSLTPRSLSQSSQYITGPSPSASNLPTTAAIGTNNCLFAADMISSLTGSDPRDVRADLGCGEWDGVPECDVDNQVVFGVLDRYTGDEGGRQGGRQGGMVEGL